MRHPPPYQTYESYQDHQVVSIRLSIRKNFFWWRYCELKMLVRYPPLSKARSRSHHTRAILIGMGLWYPACFTLSITIIVLLIKALKYPVIWVPLGRGPNNSYILSIATVCRFLIGPLNRVIISLYKSVCSSLPILSSLNVSHFFIHIVISRARSFYSIHMYKDY